LSTPRENDASSSDKVRVKSRQQIKNKALPLAYSLIKGGWTAFASGRKKVDLEEKKWIRTTAPGVESGGPMTKIEIATEREKRGKMCSG